MKLFYHTMHTPEDGTNEWPTDLDVNDEVELSARTRKALDYWEQALVQARDEGHVGAAQELQAAAQLEVFTHEAGLELTTELNKLADPKLRYSIAFALHTGDWLVYSEYFYYDSEGKLNVHA